MNNNSSISIGLNMIVKNESKVILRLLESVYKAIDFYCIVDTGSTDNTQELIKDFFDKKGIPGEIHQYHLPFNYGAARQFALEKLGTKTTHGFWIDADEELQWMGDFDKEALLFHLQKADTVKVECHFKDTQYSRHQFWRTDKPFHWRYPKHELLMCGVDATSIQIPARICSILGRPDGNSWSDKEKHRKGAKMLLDYMKTYGEDSRCIYYAAVEFANAGLHEKAIEHFRWRLKCKINLFSEPQELYYSQLMIARLCEITNKSLSQVINEYLKCSELDPLRAEHYANIILSLHKAKRFEAAYAFSSHAMTNYYGRNPYPKRSFLIEPAVYGEVMYKLHYRSCKETGREFSFNQMVEPSKDKEKVADRVVNDDDYNHNNAVDVVMLSYTKTHDIFDMTQRAIDSLHESEPGIKFNVILVETNKDLINFCQSYKGNYKGCNAIIPNQEFNYNKFVNLGIKAADNNNMVVIVNNDVLFSPSWFTNIVKAMKEHNLSSASPFCPLSNTTMQYPSDKSVYNVYIGYDVNKELFGWCIVALRKVFETIGELDERFEFYYQDNDYGLQLKKHNLLHGLVPSSIVRHLENQSHSLISKEELSKKTSDMETVFKEKYSIK